MDKICSEGIWKVEGDILSKEYFALNMWRKIILVLVVLLVLGSFFAWDNKRVSLTKQKIQIENLPENFSGLKILHVSDLHNQIFGEKQRKIIDLAMSSRADLIFITGDLIDYRHPNVDIALELVDSLRKIAPVYLVSGNHEVWSDEWGNLQKELLSMGVKIMDDKIEIMERSGEKLYILGVADPGNKIGESSNKFEEKIKKIVTGLNEKQVKILLSHRPEKFLNYVENGIDLVFSGHAHGGQIRLPLIGALVAPHQGLFPKYTSGIYQQTKTNMVVSRGLGNSTLPLRIFNNPELILVELVN